jgi:hypothetical protein
VSASAAVRERLRHAIAQHAARPVAARPAQPRPAAADMPPIAEILRGTWHETEHGRVFVRDEWYPLEHEHGALPLAAPLSACGEAVSQLVVGATAPDPSRLMFFDIETTGLSGGTGTYVVLAGIGSYERAAPGEPLAFRMRQYFLADLAQERAMLAMLARDLARCEGIVTYNGRAFDVPFIETRMTLSRLASPCGDLLHFDLLHAVRRLYRHRMPGCRLADAERRLLRIERIDDVPGALIPSLYFDYLRAGRAAPLRAVFRHNADDVLSLTGVLARLAALFSRDDLDAEDAAAVARWWEYAGEPGRAAPLYRAALPWLEGSDDWAWAASRHAMLCKRSGAREESVALWQRLWANGDAPAGVELAKHLEHRARDLAGALAMTRALLAAAPQPREREALERREARLERKLARRV